MRSSFILLPVVVALQTLPAQLPQQPPAQQPPPPDTEIYVASLSHANGKWAVGPPANVTSNKGYDNQPFFTAQGTMLFTSIRGGTQTDIYRYDFASRRVSQVTATPESEYSPTVTPDGGISVIRVEADGTQRLWRFSAEGKDPRVLLPDVKPVGYHAWSDAHTLALFVLGQPATLQVADTSTGKAKVIASDIGRSIQPIPGSHGISFVQRSGPRDHPVLTFKELDPSTGETKDLVAAVQGSGEADGAWAPDGTLFMAQGDRLFEWKRGSSAWTDVADLARLSLHGVTRLAVSPSGDRLALVGRP